LRPRVSSQKKTYRAEEREGTVETEQLTTLSSHEEHRADLTEKERRLRLEGGKDPKKRESPPPDPLASFPYPCELNRDGEKKSGKKRNDYV